MFFYLIVCSLLLSAWGVYRNFCGQGSVAYPRATKLCDKCGTKNASGAARLLLLEAYKREIITIDPQLKIFSCSNAICDICICDPKSCNNCLKNKAFIAAQQQLLVATEQKIATINPQLEKILCSNATCKMYASAANVVATNKNDAKLYVILVINRKRLTNKLLSPLCLESFQCMVGLVYQMFQEEFRAAMKAMDEITEDSDGGQEMAKHGVEANLAAVGLIKCADMLKTLQPPTHSVPNRL
jgi:hypothetical protein